MFRAAQRGVVEIEILVYKIFREFGGGGIDEMPTQISLPVVDRGVRESCIGGFEKIRLMDVDIARLDQIDLLEVIGPLPIRRQRLQIGLCHLVVVFLRIAQFDPGARGFGQLCLERENLLRMIARGRLRLAQQRQHLRDMIDILVAQLLRSIVRLGVIIAVRHAEPTLDCVRNHHRAVFVVLSGAESEQCADAEGVEMCDLFQQVIAILDCVDPLELIR